MRRPFTRFFIRLFTERAAPIAEKFRA